MTTRRFRAPAIALGLLVATTFAPTARAAEGTVTIRLVDVPTDQAEDPRAHQYFVDATEPGGALTRTVEVNNGTGEAVSVDLYAGAADVEGDEFVFGDRRTGNELTSWTSVEPDQVHLDPGAGAQARITVAVPDDVTEGERYAVVWAELQGESAAGVQTVNRVGVRMYISVTTGAAATSSFDVHSVEATRGADGTPVAAVAVENTGDRALDLTGEVQLTDGPGSASAGPFTTEAATTVAPGADTTLDVAMPADLPAGPWTASVVVRSGAVERTATASITFPAEAGRSTGPVAARAEASSGRPQPANNATPVAGVAGAAAAGVTALAGTGMVVRGRMLRRRGVV